MWVGRQIIGDVALQYPHCQNVHHQQQHCGHASRQEGVGVGKQIGMHLGGSPWQVVYIQVGKAKSRKWVGVKRLGGNLVGRQVRRKGANCQLVGKTKKVGNMQLGKLGWSWGKKKHKPPLKKRKGSTPKKLGNEKSTNIQWKKVQLVHQWVLIRPSPRLFS